jgi:hypothetical protein
VNLTELGAALGPFFDISGSPSHQQLRDAFTRTNSRRNLAFRERAIGRRMMDSPLATSLSPPICLREPLSTGSAPHLVSTLHPMALLSPIVR